MTASDDTPRVGESADGSIDYDRERQLRDLLKGQADLVHDRAHRARREDDLAEAAELYREIARDSAFIAELIETVAQREDDT